MARLTTRRLVILQQAVVVLKADRFIEHNHVFVVHSIHPKNFVMIVIFANREPTFGAFRIIPPPVLPLVWINKRFVVYFALILILWHLNFLGQAMMLIVNVLVYWFVVVEEPP